MTELGRFVADDTIRFERHFPAAPETVWDYLTRSELLSEWLGSGEIALEVGGRVELRSGGPTIRGTVMACEPPILLSHSWLVFMPDFAKPVTIESTLRYELERRGDKTVLLLTQGPIEAEYRSRTAAGWHALLDILHACIAGEQAPDFIDTFHRVHPEYETFQS